MEPVTIVVAAVGAAITITKSAIEGKKARRVVFANEQAAQLAEMQAGEAQLAGWIEQRAEAEQRQLATLGFLIIGAFLLFMIIVYKLIRKR